MYNSKQIANFFLKKSFEEKIPVNIIKLLRLLYYSYGWYLYFKKEPLINEYVVATEFGPYFPSIASYFNRYFGIEPITFFAKSPSNVGNKSFIEQIPEDEFVVALLDKVWYLYKDWTAEQLGTVSRSEGTPWYIYMKSLDRTPRVNEHIPDELIMNYFKEFYENQNVVGEELSDVTVSSE